MTEPDLTLADVLQPDWAVSSRVRACVTTRNGGVSEPPYGRWRNGADASGGLNLGTHTGDDLVHVEANRARLVALAGARPAWLEQVHGSDVVQAEHALAALDAGSAPLRADASVTARPGVACVVMVADCMPVLICDPAGRAVGAAHAGWRGLAAGVIEKTAVRVAGLAGCAVESLQVYLGPAIGPTAFEVGADVRDAFMNSVPAVDASRQAGTPPAIADATARAFVAHSHAPDKYLANLPALARLRLNAMGIESIAGGDRCTVTDREHFYSYRRDRVTGRMAAMIWLND
ncbi:peptidoglycan editing factor PgeF [Paraburkholderia kururiensis]|uniref:Purine nucleoside phosphorylase n=1 Tax=Paraburkholderia kururiensis TaxID=984307 RepID=A0ABZ0WSE7_9BURK|nr:peptidoglycan editing factor PgeF [Paraburkholderia kururiensis]WQD80193.1 peptidoglycan editing factor PgeF [Paraburkholderia kururiensis]